VTLPSDADWYYPGDVPRTVREAKQRQSVATEDIVSILAAREFDAPKPRVESVVATTLKESPVIDEGDSQQSLAAPRLPSDRFVGIQDLRFLGADAMATILGAALSRYEGEFQTPDDVDGIDLDVFWHRDTESVAFWTVPNEPGETVGEDKLTSVQQELTELRAERSPDVFGVVTTTGFTDAAQEFESKTELKLFNRQCLARWLRDARLPLETIGLLLDEGKQDLEETSVAENLSPLPTPVRRQDPLAIDVQSERPSGSVDGSDRHDIDRPSDERTSTGVRDQPISSVDTPSVAGQRGELYADPEEDGDYGSFDEYIDQLESGDEP
jgi:hypothetical protein